MATDYDAPRRSAEDEPDDSIEALKSERAASSSSASPVDLDEADLAEGLELPGADLSNEELTVRVVPKQADEFTCTRCFLVAHASQRQSPGVDVCRDCA